MKNFQIIILIVFIAAAVVGILAFSGMIPIGNQSDEEGSGGTVVLWGTVRSADIGKALENFNRANRTYTLKYEEKRAETFDQELLEALASGTGPDLFLISDDLVYKYNNKLLMIPYQSYPISVFRQNFAGAGEVFLTSDGFLAFPLAIDPLVMYYNRSVLDTNNIVYPPEYWDRLSLLAPTLSKKDDNRKILQSAVALGQFSNVVHAKEILAMLFMQAGNPIVVEKNGTFVSTLKDSVGSYHLDEVLESYTDFADPLKEIYSWNKSLPNSRDAFSAENVAFYFGFASELRPLIERNPNQNFMVAPVPQIPGAQSKLTSARVTGVGVSAFSKNLNSAFSVGNLLAAGDFAKEFASVTGTAPARRDLLVAAPNPDDPYQPVFYASALFARSWLDPSPDDSNEVFQAMVERVLSNSLTPTQAIRDADSKLNILLVR